MIKPRGAAERDGQKKKKKQGRSIMHLTEPIKANEEQLEIEAHNKEALCAQVTTH